MDFLPSLGKLMDGARDGAEQGRDAAEAQAEASQMSPLRLQAQIQYLTQQLQEKSELLNGIQEKLQALPVREMLGEQGNDLKDQAADIMAAMDALRTRLAVFQKTAQ